MKLLLFFFKFTEAYVECYWSAVWIYSVKIVDGNEHSFDFAAGQVDFAVSCPRESGKIGQLM